MQHACNVKHSAQPCIAKVLVGLGPMLSINWLAGSRPKASAGMGEASSLSMAAWPCSKLHTEYSACCRHFIATRLYGQIWTGTRVTSQAEPSRVA